MKWFFYANVSFEPWDYRNSIEKGIGGSETSQVEVTRTLAKLGHDVTSFAPIPDDCPPEWEGVKWRHKDTADFSEPGVWVLYRCPNILDQFDGRRPDQVVHLVFQDWWYSTLTPDRVAKIDRAVILCRAHERFLLDRCPFLQGLTWITRNAIKNDLIAEVEAAGLPERNPRRIMYASSPDRGLRAALLTYQRAKEVVPDLEFVATYGYDNLNKMIANGADPKYARDRDECLRLVEETGARFAGRIPQRRLYEEWFRTGMLLYITDFFETGWITGLEGQAMGAIPVFSPVFAQGENTRHGIAVHGPPTDPATIARAAGEVIRLATDFDLQDRIRKPMMEDVRANWGWEQFVWKKPNENWVQAAEEDYARKRSATTDSGPPASPLCDNPDEAAARARWLHLSPGEVFVDVGAADGSWAFPAADQGAHVHAFEPNPRTQLKALMDRAAPGPGLVVRYFAGCGDRCGQNDFGGSVVTLDSFAVEAKVDRVDFVKVDVEGQELAVLRGAVGLLRRWAPRLMVEVHTETVRGVRVELEQVTGFLDSLGVGYRYEPVELAYQGKRYWHLYAYAEPGEVAA